MIHSMNRFGYRAVTEKNDHATYFSNDPRIFIILFKKKLNPFLQVSKFLFSR